jgi:hypothetical protein
MKNKLLLITFLASFSSSVFANVCMDDPRMFTIKTVLEQAVNGTPYKPLKLTPETFLKLTPATRQALGDNITVYNEQCIPQEIFKGQLPSKIEMPYEDLAYALHMSMIQNDLKTANVITSSFISSSKTPSDIVRMITPLAWHDNATNHLYDQGLLQKRSMINTYDDADIKLCNATLSDLTHLELFSALGGKANETDLVTYEFSSAHIDFEARNSNASTKTAKKFDNTEATDCIPYNTSRILSNLETNGIEIQEVTSGSGSDRAFKQYDQAIKQKGSTQSSELN